MIFETFSFRKRRETHGEPDVYSYDVAPEHLRHQICMTFCEGIGHFEMPSAYSWDHVPNANKQWETIDKICRKELYSYLQYTRESNLLQRFYNYIMGIKNIDEFLSAVEIGCIMLAAVKDDYGAKDARGAEQRGDHALEEINQRFEQHAIGYRFENMRLIRVDSKLTHAEIIKPALKLLTAPLFAKANDEFMTTHSHYRMGNHKDCVTAANRAFECMLKAICDAESWDYTKGDRAADLVTKVTTNGLFTHEFDKSFSAYVAMLKAGLPTVRNDAGAHGEGTAAVAVTPQIARYAINLTATNILFLGESYMALKGR
ncbi:MAG: hypothetical protein P4L68_09900 [Methylovirgula sp.]|nr:hypothetical protein [Methylovirgula sp.]